MFRAIILPIFRSTRMCVTVCGIMHPRCCRPVAWKRRKRIPPLPGYRQAISWVHYTTNCYTHSSAPENGQNNCPKHVELIGIINKLIVASSWLSILFISMMHGQANIKLGQYFTSLYKCTLHSPFVTSIWHCTMWALESINQQTNKKQWHKKDHQHIKSTRYVHIIIGSIDTKFSHSDKRMWNSL